MSGPTPNLDAVLEWWRGGDLSAPIAAPALVDPERPFIGRNWTSGRLIAYSIASAASGSVAQLPPRPIPEPTRPKHAQKMPSHRKRNRGKK